MSCLRPALSLVRRPSSPIRGHHLFNSLQKTPLYKPQDGRLPKETHSKKRAHRSFEQDSTAEAQHDRLPPCGQSPILESTYFHAPISLPDEHITHMKSVRASFHPPQHGQHCIVPMGGTVLTATASAGVFPGGTRGWSGRYRPRLRRKPMSPNKTAHEFALLLRLRSKETLRNTRVLFKTGTRPL